MVARELDIYIYTHIYRKKKKASEIHCKGRYMFDGIGAHFYYCLVGKVLFYI